MINGKVYLCTVFLAAGLAISCGGDASKPANSQQPQNNTGNVNQPARPDESTMPVNGAQPGNAARPTTPAPAGKDPTTRGDVPTGTGVEAPDDSVVNTELVDNVTETRTFKNHPQLQKIVRVTFVNENNRRATKIYLKDGAVKEVAESKIGDSMKAPAADIMKALGK